MHGFSEDIYYMNTELDLKNVADIVLKKWKILVIVTVVAMTATFIYSSTTAVPLYKSSLNLFVKNSSLNSESGKYITQNEITSQRSLADTYVAVLGSNELSFDMTKSFNEKLGRTFSISKIKGMVKISKSSESEIINVSVTSEDPHLSKQMCDIIHTDVVPIALDIVGAGELISLGAVQENKNPVSPNIPKNVLASGFAAALITAVIILLIHICKNKITDTEELSKKFNIPVLGEIPEAVLFAKERYSYDEKNQFKK